MSTLIRPEISKRNPYHIDKERHLELKHFCLQYRTWRKRYTEIELICSRSCLGDSVQNGLSNPVERYALSKLYYSDRIDLVKRTALEACPELSNYILLCVTEGLSYESLLARYGIPCCKDTFYKYYRRFFWLLDQYRE